MSEVEAPALDPDSDRSQAPPVPRRGLAHKLEGVVHLASEETVAVRALVEHLGVRGHALLSLLLSLPFLQPVPLPGLSTPIGAAVVLVGTFMALGLPPWLPQRWMERQLPSRHVLRVVTVGQRLLKRGERFIKPRGLWLHRKPWTRPIGGFIIAVSGAELALPIPILFTNTLPALVIATISVALAEEDSLLTAIGTVLFVAVSAVLSLVVVLPLMGLRVLF